MPAYIALQDLAAATPDGKTLFDQVTLSFGAERTGLVGRNGVGKTTLLRLIAGEVAPAAGTIAREGRIRLLRQAIGDDPRDAIADLFDVKAALARLARLDAGTVEADDLAEADWTLPARLEEALARVGLPGIAFDRALATLSGGQRTRAALATLTFDAPDMVLLDEPTNNLDRAGRCLVADLLHGWRGGAIVVSHDRALLREMDRIVELSPLGARVYGGNYDLYAERRAAERDQAAQTLDAAQRKSRQVDRDIQAARETKARRDTAGTRAHRKGGQPKMLLDAMQDRAERSGGRAGQLAERQRLAAAEAVRAAEAEVERVALLRIDLAGARLPADRVVLELDGVSGGPVDRDVVRNLSLRICGPERVALTGPNGAGKTTVLRLVTGDLAPRRGAIRTPAPWTFLDQSLAILEAGSSIRDNFRRLNPDADENACRAALARFLFRADVALKRVDRLSGGERLRGGLACVLGGAKPPALLMLDEPTNHLDLDSIAAIEAGLQSFGGALLVVSHDEDFLVAIGVTRRIQLAVQERDTPSSG